MAEKKLKSKQVISQLTKIELITRTAGQCGLTVDQAKDFVKQFFTNIADGLSERGRVEVTGWAIFELENKSERVARNPKTGLEVHVEPRSYVKIAAGKYLKDKSTKRQG